MGVVQRGMDGSSRERPSGWRKSSVVGILAVAVIVGGVWCVIVWARGPQAVTYTKAYQCSSCGYTMELPLRPAVNPPLVCEKCGEESMHAQWRCACGRLFAWEAPRNPGELDESTLSGDRKKRERMKAKHEKQLEAYGNFSMPCPKCEGTDVYEEFTASHKRVMVKYQKYLSEHGKQELSRKYGIEF